MSVTLKSFATGKVLSLKGAKLDAFNEELKLVTKRPAGKGLGGLKIAPDCSIAVKAKGKKTEYLLYSRTVLRDVKTNKVWQFYLGLLLLEWLA